MSYITHFDALHAVFRRSKLLLTFSRYQVMYDVSCVVPRAKVTCNGQFVLQQQSNEENQALDRCSGPALSWIYTSF